MDQLMENATEMKLEEKMMKLKEDISRKDAYICQDNNDLAELERRYEKLNLPHKVRRIIDDYIACIQTRDERLSELCYIYGTQERTDTATQTELSETEYRSLCVQ